MVIHSRIMQPDWTRGRCTKFPINGPEDDVWFYDAEEALPICNGFEDERPCPVRDQCLLSGLINNEYGVFGGMTMPQRKWIRKHVPKKMWWDVPSEDVPAVAAYLRKKVPPPEYFSDWGNLDPDEDDDDAA